MVLTFNSHILLYIFTNFSAIIGTFIFPVSNRVLKPLMVNYSQRVMFSSLCHRVIAAEFLTWNKLKHLWLSARPSHKKEVPVGVKTWVRLILLPFSIIIKAKRIAKSDPEGIPSQMQCLNQDESFGIIYAMNF